jgi:hypothetical protein
MLEDAALFAIREVLRRRHAEVVEAEAGRHVLDADELARVRVWQRLDQRAITTPLSATLGRPARLPS